MTPEERQQRLQALYQELQVKNTELSELLRDEPTRLEEDFEFESSDGTVKLSELFGDHRDLIVVHNMGKGCNYCTLWADGLAGVTKHLESRVSFVLCSPDTPDAQKTFAESRGWPFRTVTDAKTNADDPGFTRKLGFLRDEDGREQWWPGFSTFRLDDHDRIVHVASDYFGPGDRYMPVWHMFDLLEGGPKGWQPKAAY